VAGIGAYLGAGLGSCCSSGCGVRCSLSLGFSCCCGWHFTGTLSCVVPACCETSRPAQSCRAVSSLPPFLAPWATAALCPLALASTSAVMSPMPIPHCTLSLWRSSHFLSLFSSHSFNPSYCALSGTACASSILASLSMVWCSWVTTRTCGLTVHSIRPLQPLGVLTCSEVLFLGHIWFLLHSHSSLPATKDTRVVFPILWPAVLLASPASAMPMSLSNGGFSIVPPLRLLSTWVAIVAGLLDIASHLWSRLLLSWGAESVIWVSVRCQKWSATVCMSLAVRVAELFESLYFWSSLRVFAHPHSCMNFCAR